MPIGLGSSASHQPKPLLLPARRPTAALQPDVLLSSAAALQLLTEADRATWCDACVCQSAHDRLRFMCQHYRPG